MPFKMETMQAVAKAAQPSYWMVSLDLKDAYLHIPIREKDKVSQVHDKATNLPVQSIAIRLNIITSIFYKSVSSISGLGKAGEYQRFPLSGQLAQ